MIRNQILKGQDRSKRKDSRKQSAGAKYCPPQPPHAGLQRWPRKEGQICEHGSESDTELIGNPPKDTWNKGAGSASQNNKPTDVDQSQLFPLPKNAAGGCVQWFRN